MALLPSKRKISQEKRAWLSENSKSEWLPTFVDWRHQKPGTTQKSYVQRWVEQCNAGNIKSIQIRSGDGVWQEVFDQLKNVDRFGLILHTDNKIDISDKLVYEVVVEDADEIVLRQCAVKKIDLRSQNARRIALLDCNIGRLEIRSNSVASLEIIGGSIDSIAAPTPSQPAPFTGSVEIRNVALSPTFENAQAYRNLRHHLTALHNHEAASIFHAAEMRAEVSRQSSVDRMISAFYSAISNYGGSSARPLAIFAFLLIFHMAYLYILDGVVPLGDAVEADGWRYDLYGLDASSRALRSSVFALNQTINPFGVFGTRLLLAAKTPLIALASGVLGLTTALTFTLFVLAVRRRFRLEKG